MGLSRSYYFKTTKIVRDLVHEYVGLTRFELEIVDTVPFQRLKDVRQLTCQHVYPAAHHTRFEHSLGVLELTRQAIMYLNTNGIIGSKGVSSSIRIIDENLEFNILVAALLHDLGHCPFSHMGESEFDAEEVRQYLCDVIVDNQHLNISSDLHDKLNKNSKKGIGAVHEQLSCIIVIEKYSSLLMNLEQSAINDEDDCSISVDFELIVRSILGIEYDVSTFKLLEENRVKNALVRLINSSTFDMDKLDYIMRDSFYAGIGAPTIDTRRLFENMYFSSNLTLLFTRKAVPVLQNMIDARDGLYMYVYNHHAVIFSDFLHGYISRRLSHNAEEFISLAYPRLSKEEIKEELDCFQITSLGLIPKPYLFSVGAIKEGNRSDSDWLSLLNIIHFHYQDSIETIQSMILGEFARLHRSKAKIAVTKVSELSEKIRKALLLVHQYETRAFLKPWWKTVFEFSNFMHQHFRDDSVRGLVGKWICDGGDLGLEAAELRSQIAKHVIYITQKLHEEQYEDLIVPLSEGDFFAIQRSTRFFAPDIIEKLEICLKSSEIIGMPVDVSYQEHGFYIKTLTNIIPQKNYTSIYAREGFYIFMKPVMNCPEEVRKKQHYKLIEQIFVFVATEFVHRGEQLFIRMFQPPQSILNRAMLVKECERKSMVDMSDAFSKSLHL